MLLAYKFKDKKLSFNQCNFIESNQIKMIIFYQIFFNCIVSFNSYICQSVHSSTSINIYSWPKGPSSNIPKKRLYILQCPLKNSKNNDWELYYRIKTDDRRIMADPMIMTRLFPPPWEKQSKKIYVSQFKLSKNCGVFHLCTTFDKWSETHLQQMKQVGDIRTCPIKQHYRHQPKKSLLLWHFTFIKRAKKMPPPTHHHQARPSWSETLPLWGVFFLSQMANPSSH